MSVLVHGSVDGARLDDDSLFMESLLIRSAATRRRAT
jgi:hypothetical protein